jgi:hypothetical protein
MPKTNSTPGTALAEKGAVPTSRKHFLRRLGITLAVAVGAGTFVQSAFAVSNCCTACADCTACWNGYWGCLCSCQCPDGNSYCWVSGPCLDTQTCVQCPC